MWRVSRSRQICLKYSLPWGGTSCSDFFVTLFLFLILLVYSNGFNSTHVLVITANKYNQDIKMLFTISTLQKLLQNLGKRMMEMPNTADTMKNMGSFLGKNIAKHDVKSAISGVMVSNSCHTSKGGHGFLVFLTKYWCKCTNFWFWLGTGKKFITKAVCCVRSGFGHNQTILSCRSGWIHIVTRIEGNLV